MINRERLKNVPPRVNIIGVPISAVNMDSTVQFLLENRDAIKGNYICVSNVHTTVMAHDNTDYYNIQANSLLSVPDGKPLSVIGRKEQSNMDRVTGPDLMRIMFEKSKACDLRHYFYGTTKEILSALIEKIQKDYPWVNVVGYEPSVFRPMSKEEEEELVQRINQTEPDIVWVALGAPRQEEFCSRQEGKISGVTIGVGGAFSVVSGVIEEAPRWLQDLSLEWLYRLLKEPKRLFKRYFVTNNRFIYLYIKDRLSGRKGRRAI